MTDRVRRHVNRQDAVIYLHPFRFYNDMATVAEAQAQLMNDYTFRELQLAIHQRTGEMPNERTLQRWLYQICWWCGWQLSEDGTPIRRKSLFSEQDLDWLLFWRNFKNTRSRSVAEFYLFLEKINNDENPQSA